MKITKADLINRMHASNTSLTKIKAYDAVETTLQIIKSSLEDGDDVLLSGFGKFCVKEKSARKGRNPRTGDVMMLDARRVVTFKPSWKLRQALNKSR